MSADEIIANDIQTLVKQEFIYSAPFFQSFLIALALILIGAFYIIYYPVLLSAIAIVATGCIIVIFLFQIISGKNSFTIPQRPSQQGFCATAWDTGV